MSGGILPAQMIRDRCMPSVRDNKLGPTIRSPMVAPFRERTEVVRYNNSWVVLHDYNEIMYPRGKFKRFSFGLSCAGYDVRLAEDMWLWPFWGRLGSTIERFDLPNDIVAEIADKSSWIRRFVVVGNSKAEPGWRGHLTLELMRFLPWPVKLRKGTPIAHILFHQLVAPTEQPYDGKYQDQQAGPQSAR